jgi:3-phosphoshikimate 1-carboxyvinyltransferase
VKLYPPKEINFVITPPASKSITHRALIIASLAKGTSGIINPSRCEDAKLLVEALKLEDNLTVNQEGAKYILKGISSIPKKEFYGGNSATVFRFLTALVSLFEGEYLIDCAPRMKLRPIKGLVDALLQQGVKVDYLEKIGFAPIRIRSNGLEGGRCVLDAKISSQFLSALLLTTPCARGDTHILLKGLTSRPYIDMTLEVMKAFGIEPHKEGYKEFFIKGNSNYTPRDYVIEPDASSANYFFALGALGGRVRVEGLGRSSIQGELGFLEVLSQMGAKVIKGDNFIEVRSSRLRGVDVDMNGMPDSVCTLGVLSLFAEGKTRIRNVGNLRFKESDRLSALASELSKLGAWVEEYEDGLSITPPRKFTPSQLQPYNDHRLAMSFAIAAFSLPGLSIANPDCVKKSYPDFFKDLKEAGFKEIFNET